MKKLGFCILVLFVMICSGSFAATQKAAASGGNPLVGKIGIGAQGFSLTKNAITMPMVQYYLNDDMAVEGGFCIGSNSSVTNMTIAAAVKNRFLKPLGNIYPQWGVGISYTSNPGMVANSSLLLIALNVGAEWLITPDFAIECNISPLMLSTRSVGGSSSTSWTMLSNAVAPPVVVIGAHLYI